MSHFVNAMVLCFPDLEGVFWKQGFKHSEFREMPHVISLGPSGGRSHNNVKGEVLYEELLKWDRIRRSWLLRSKENWEIRAQALLLGLR